MGARGASWAGAAGRLQQVPLAIGGGSHVGRGVDGPDGVTGADQEVC